MSQKPPHLPENELFRRNGFLHGLSIWWVIFLIVISILSGVSASVITDAWLAPNFIFSDAGLLSRRSIVDDSNAVPLELDNIVRQKVVSLYDKKSLLGGKFYSDKGLIGQAAIVSSDGWAVMFDYFSNRNLLPVDFEVIDNKGLVYNVERMVRDPVNDLVYVKFASNSIFPVIDTASIYDVPNIGGDIWALNYPLWEKVDFSAYLPDLSVSSYPIYDQTNVYKVLNNDIKSGDLLFLPNGRLVGVVGSSNNILDLLVLEQNLLRIIEEKPIQLGVLVWEGYFVNQQIIDGTMQNMNGFYLVKSYPSDNLNKGDIILEIQGQEVSSSKLKQQIIESPDNVEVKVFRSATGEEEIINVKKRIVSNL